MRFRPLCSLPTVALMIGLTLCESGRGEVPDLQKPVEALVAPLIQGQWTAGLAIGLIEGGRTHVFGFGDMGRTHGTKPDGDTLFEIGSVSKVFTATVLADLVRTGRVKLDDPVAKLLPAGTVVPRSGDRDITLADLATHTSGLPRLPTNFAPHEGADPYADYSENNLYDFLKAYVLPRPPGASYEYSNVGAGLLGYALALRDRATYEELIQRHVTRPLGLTSPLVRITPPLLPRFAVGHDADGEVVPAWDFLVLGGAGALRSTVNDMVSFLLAELGPATGPLGNAFQLTQEARHVVTPGMSIGLGWHITDADGTRWHNGQTGGFHSYVAIRKDRGLGVVVLANSASGCVDSLGTALLHLIAGESPGALDVQVAIALTPAQLAPYVARYRLSPTFELTVTQDADRLMVQGTGQGKFRLYAEAADRFFAKAVAARFTFERDPAGHIVRLVLQQSGHDSAAPVER